MNKIHSFFDLFIHLFILLANMCQIPSWESTYSMQRNSINEFVSIVLHCQIQMSKKNSSPPTKSTKILFIFFVLTLPQILESPLMLKSSHSSSAVSTLGGWYTGHHRCKDGWRLVPRLSLILYLPVFSVLFLLSSSIAHWL